ncbi:ribosome recycling factor [Roseivirga pacifica]|uniref:Ribosome-recycling factor n=1 Tax=Roseivirga pacifica TaxID=1267423 RepID=A0A1I0NXR9_9BACT|nr:ribosome recycling factor [Roseivirga pacifica]MCO6360077.1 ribosome recycling factor [Roseivirga pacifica]MCO6367448.1 ribosome recycling factor [Roseivirga pacifica]MCO6370021.1 ribosome recycling factor [Roseivirga pacifica]MCO6375104.1 ribosome recycling factor [Roseivirga pacifica]MCO6380363.1 ribosome recycling factor [Roseivirga pacifica]|tara:strand:+ start:1344 stop:1904 length:561 start_codon:yes stop_codon:yes gene_type:complete
MEEIELYLDTAKEMMEKAVDHAKTDLAKIRAGKAMPSMLDGLMVEYYGTPTPINQVASVTTPDARTLFVKPWEKSIISEIEKAIINSDLGFNPQNDGESIIINVPQLTEERRVQLTKQAKAVTENGKVSVRNARKEANDELKKLLKDGVSEDMVKGAEDDVQQLTDKFTKKMDDLLEHKEKEIMTV